MSVTIAAEIGMAHDGHLDRLEPYAKAARDAGADTLKFQAHSAAESSALEQWRVPPASGESRLDYWTRTAWNADQWRTAIGIAHAYGLKAVIAPFSRTMIQVLAGIPEMDGWKVPSGLLSDPEALRMIASEGRPVWCSSGLSDAKEVRRARDIFRFRQDVTYLHCVSLYPCPPEASGLGCLIEDCYMTEECGADGYFPYGWSDHTGDPALIYAAVGLGATVVEVHLELGTEQTPDTSAAWSPARLAELVQGIRRIEQGLASNDKDAIAASVAHLRPFYTYTLLDGRVAKHQGHGEPIR